MIDFKRVFIDTSPLIYYLENSPLYMDRIKKSLQIVAAKVSKCDIFFTNDKQLRQEKELPCMTMDDL